MATAEALAATAKARFLVQVPMIILPALTMPPAVKASAAAATAAAGARRHKVQQAGQGPTKAMGEAAPNSRSSSLVQAFNLYQPT
jgi:hypothetical protein